MREDEDMARDTRWSMTSTTPETDHGVFVGTRKEAVAEARRLGATGAGVVDDGDTVKVYTEPID